MRYITLILFNLILVSARRSSRVGGLAGGSSSGSGSGSYVIPNPFPERLTNNEINHSGFGSPGAIAGTVVGCVAFVAITVVFMLWRRKIRLEKDQEAGLVTVAADAADTMPYAQRVAMEEALALRNPPKVKKTSWF